MELDTYVVTFKVQPKFLGRARRSVRRAVLDALLDHVVLQLREDNLEVSDVTVAEVVTA